jgi:bifunctional N-acetylglucosamine-1-phosphate-uridyltransferase/glucosamine-1-phosphate-acetyltransferase GlmU-like protein
MLALLRKNPLVFLFLGIDYLWVWALANTFGRLAYASKYFRTRHFTHIWSPGWRWVYNGMFAKLFTAKGRGIPWPIGGVLGINPANIEFHPDDLNNFQGNVYFQCWSTGKITLGHGTYIAQGCALITTNHDPSDLDRHLPSQDIVLGEKCWLGANAVIMPGVVLGDRTIVGANAVVTKSYPEGNCVLVGVPAKVISKTAS